MIPVYGCHSLSLYAKGMTTREIVATFKEMYDADVSPTLISKVTDAVLEQVMGFCRKFFNERLKYQHLTSGRHTTEVGETAWS